MGCRMNKCLLCLGVERCVLWYLNMDILQPVCRNCLCLCWKPVFGYLIMKCLDIRWMMEHLHVCNNYWTTTDQKKKNLKKTAKLKHYHQASVTETFMTLQIARTASFSTILRKCVSGNLRHISPK